MEICRILCVCVTKCGLSLKQTDRKTKVRLINFVGIFLFSLIGTSLSIIFIASACPEGFTILSLYIIPKSVAGCYCSNDDSLKVGSCSDQEKNLCQNIDSQNSIETKSLGASNDQKNTIFQICGKTSKLQFYELLQNQTNNLQDCKDKGFKVCETSNPQNFYCVIENEKCPIRDLIIRDTKLSDDQVNSYDYEEIYSNEFYVYISRSKDAQPIVDIKIIKGKGVCTNNQIATMSYLIHKLLICLLDETYFQVSTLPERYFFVINQVDTVIQTLHPYYQIRNDIQYTLQAQYQMYYKIDCRKENFQILTDLSSNIDKQYLLIELQVIFGAYLNFATLMLFLVEFIRCFDSMCKNGHIIFSFLFELTSLYLFMVTVLVCYQNQANLCESLQTQYDRKCFDSSVQIRIQEELNSFQGKPLYLSYALIVMIALTLLINFITYILFCFGSQIKKMMKKNIPEDTLQKNIQKGQIQQNNDITDKQVNIAKNNSDMPVLEFIEEDKLNKQQVYKQIRDCENNLK